MAVKIILCIVGAYFISKALCRGSENLAMLWAALLGIFRNYACWESLSDDLKMEEVKSIVKELTMKHWLYRFLLTIGSLDKENSLLEEAKEL